jgi:hypothetical protein
MPSASFSGDASAAGAGNGLLAKNKTARARHLKSAFTLSIHFGATRRFRQCHQIAGLDAVKLFEWAGNVLNSVITPIL